MVAAAHPGSGLRTGEGSPILRCHERDPVQPALFDFPRDLPQGLLYQPEFVTPEEEAALLCAIAPLPLREAKFREYFAKRRVAHFHADTDTPRYDDGGVDSFTSGPMPPLVAALRDKVAGWLGLAAADFVHALVSEYRPERRSAGIAINPSMALSWASRWRAGGGCAFRPYEAQDARHTVALDLAPRSVYVMREAIRWDWQHSMLPTKELR
jgi:alkylated DNA repair dioxygenase AlkB